MLQHTFVPCDQQTPEIEADKSGKRSLAPPMVGQRPFGAMRKPCKKIRENIKKMRPTQNVIRDKRIRTQLPPDQIECDPRVSDHIAGPDHMRELWTPNVI
uniref:Uncharacterized protein n=1 Tax=Steinernema glaseri TaxID=37863 RepID=A0A1I8ACQ5_9BILA